MTITNSTISGNVTGAGGTAANYYYFLGTAGSGGNGGAIANDGTLTITSSTLSGNRTGNGADGAAMCGNGGNGAGIANTNTLVLSNSTVSQNRNGGGGSRPGGTGTNACLAAPNLGDGLGGSGGGLANSGTASLVNATLSGNVAGPASPVGGANGVGGGVSGSGGSLTLSNALLAGNLDPAGEDDLSGSYVDAVTGQGGLTGSDQFNLVGLTFNGTTYTAAQILSSAGLARNGGPTRTIALATGSPALGVAAESVCQGPPVNGKDQRGVIRPTSACDLGAYEATS
jgi:hypothetical protein